MSHSPQDSIPPRNTLPGLVAVSLCAAAGMGCPAAQVRPEPETCTQEAQRNTFEVLKLHGGMRLQAVIDVNQPGEREEEGTYHDGPVTSRVVQRDWSPEELPGGTLLKGRLWTGPGIQNQWGSDAVMGRYTEAKLPDGRTLAVCLTLGGPDGYWEKQPGSQPGAARLPREVPVSAVRRWP